MIAAKTVVIILGLLYLFGLAWSAGSVEASTQWLVSIGVLCAFLLALFPQQHIKPGAASIILISAACIGITALFALLVDDLTRSYGVDVIGVAMNAIFIFAVAYLGRGVWESSKKK